MVIIWVAWSEREERIGCIFGNHSISMWSREDNYKYEINVPLGQQYAANPFIIIRYMDSMRKWIVVDNRPVIHVLDENSY
jgi:hypothetical protein